eukprot:m.88977 g.88977  ORF g.88977 m.88977 type:complete len:354 (-) comp20037_c0_seq1:919-1980(-)
MHPDNRWTPGADPNSHLQLTWMEIEHGRGHLEIGTQLGCEGIVKVARGHVKLHPRDVGELVDSVEHADHRRNLHQPAVAENTTDCHTRCSDPLDVRATVGEDGPNQLAQDVFVVGGVATTRSGSADDAAHATPSVKEESNVRDRSVGTVVDLADERSDQFDLAFRDDPAGHVPLPLVWESSACQATVCKHWSGRRFLMIMGTTYEYRCRGVRSGLTHHHGVAGELSVVLRDCRQLLHDVPRVRGWSRRGAIRRPAPRVRLGDQATGVAHPDRRCPSGERPCRRVDLARRAHVRSHRSRERTEWQPKDDVEGVNLCQHRNEPENLDVLPRGACRCHPVPVVFSPHQPLTHEPPC